MNALLVFHGAVTWALLGLIWTIQVVHYPLFKDVGETNFVAFHKRHMSLISWVVGPLMVAEVGSAGLLLFLGERSLLFGASVAALAVIWAATAILQVPLHRKLALGYDAAAIRHLVRTNQWRTLAWTVRGFCLAAILVRQLQ